MEILEVLIGLSCYLPDQQLIRYLISYFLWPVLGVSLIFLIIIWDIILDIRYHLINIPLEHDRGLAVDFLEWHFFVWKCQ